METLGQSLGIIIGVQWREITKFLLRESFIHMNNFSHRGSLKSMLLLEAEGEADSGKISAIFCISDT